MSDSAYVPKRKSNNEPKEQERIAPHPVLDEYYDSEAARRKRVDNMFDSSAEHYDWICNMMSFGSGKMYRKQALLRAGLQKGMSVLDVGAGTGVVSLLEQEIVGNQGTVIALDPSRGMLGEAQRLGVEKATMGLGEALPFPDNSFDMLTMGFALRHVSDLKKTFVEYNRVLKPGGKILLLEISKPASPVATFFLKAYMKGVIPIATRIFRRSANAQELMRYYWDTIEQCVPPKTIIKALESSGSNNSQRNVVMGIFSEYSGTK